MPLRPGSPAGESIAELSHGKTYKKTKAKFGKTRARKQAIAIALANERKGKKKTRKVARKGGRRG